jgi:DNA invertase Pin-like site-specific DNA recombinase
MNTLAHQKIAPHHLKRLAYLYVRQSTVRQVLENTESTKRQYALRERAAALGWPGDRVVVIDNDLGQSGASAVDREGFQRLVADVGMGRVGIVLGLEVSRLARNSSDWHRLLEICALTRTLILDEDGLYDPCHFNDRLLLGLKGTMSEAELHVLHSRLQGGILSKAKRGELRIPLPVGLVYDNHNRVHLDPDAQVQSTLRMLFETFYRTRSAAATVRAFRQQGLKFPRRPHTGPFKGELSWRELTSDTILAILHNPRYAGVYSFGRRARQGGPILPVEEWQAFIPEAHPGYISWNQYQANQANLRENSTAFLPENRTFPPREGPSLLQGLVLCGVCGRRMYVRYRSQRKGLLPSYECITSQDTHCQSIPGADLDQVVGELLVEMITPLALEASLSVQSELAAQRDRVERLLRQHVDRARYEADLARRRYMQVDPENRMVADTLEADWNARLRALDEAQEKYQRDLEKEALALNDEQRNAILGIATDFPRLWQAPTTTHQERKSIVRLLVEDIALTKTTCITAQLRFKGGTTRTLTVPIPLNAWMGRTTNPMVVQAIDHLLDDYTDGEVATYLNGYGYQSGMGMTFTALIVKQLRDDYGLKSRCDRLAARGFIKAAAMRALLGIGEELFRKRVRMGMLHGVFVSRNELWFDPAQAQTSSGIETIH